LVRAEKRASPGFARKKMIEKEHDQHHLVHSTLSSLDGGGEWKEGVKLAYKIGFKFPNVNRMNHLYCILIFYLVYTKTIRDSCKRCI
jgi:hypothetical protein